MVSAIYRSSPDGFFLCIDHLPDTGHSKSILVLLGFGFMVPSNAWWILMVPSDPTSTSTHVELGATILRDKFERTHGHKKVGPPAWFYGKTWTTKIHKNFKFSYRPSSQTRIWMGVGCHLSWCWLWLWEDMRSIIYIYIYTHNII